MFIQVIEARAKGGAQLREQMDRWQHDIRPDARGFLGASMGVTTDGIFLAAVRFETEKAAVTNARRSEQQEWWEQTSEYLERARFEDCSEVDTFLSGGSERARFVQVVRGLALNKADLKRIEMQILEWFPSVRPDYFGSWMAWNGDRFNEIAYFESAEAAHAGEERVSNSEHAADFRRWLDGITDVTYVDLHDPWHY
jgi:hypothetical protein